MHPLDGSRLKIVRAKEHLDAFKESAADYIKNTKPKLFGIQDYGDLVIAFARLDADPPPPLKLSVFVGDCVVNARTALEYIASALVIRFTTCGIDKINWRDIYFPISKSGSFKEKCFTDHKVPAEVIDLIKSVQPNRAGYECLDTLTALVNRDKHCLPIFTVAKAPDAVIKRIAVTGNSGASISFQPATPTISTGMMNTKFITDGREVEVDVEGTIFIAFEDVSMPPVPADRTLEQIIECIANIIPRFDRFF